MITSFLEEMRELSKKKQDAPLNALKVKMINRALIQVKEALKNEPSIDFLDLLDEDTLPVNSDALLILGQFDAAMNVFYKTYYRRDLGASTSRWMTAESPPRKPKL